MWSLLRTGARSKRTGRGLPAASGYATCPCLASNEGFMGDVDVVVIGAGAAGLGAATALRETGRNALVLEASARVGGRAWTTHPPELGGVWFDMGALWLHAAEHNLLVPIARSAGHRLLRADELRREQSFIGSRRLTPAERARYDEAWNRFDRAADALLRPGLPDLPLSAVARSIPDDEWAPMVEAWEGPVICAADADAFSLADWRVNGLSGSNLVPAGGIGAFVASLAAGLDIRLNTPVRRVRWGHRVEVETDRGAINAGSCVVTVSTGVLAAGTIAFDPPLPPHVQACVQALPMGLAMKVALRATGPDRLDLPLHCSVDRRVERSGDPLMPFQCWPHGRDYVQGWIGGSTAWRLAQAGDPAAVDFALNELRVIFGSRVDRLFAGGATLVTHWDADPWIRGAYAYAIPGSADARARLAEPLADGHLWFAGEACNTPYAGTLGGAWLSGQAAAKAAA
jgi:monoamine oxidase